MSETSERHLHLVEEVTVEDPAVHPLLDGSTVFLSSQDDPESNGQIHTARFTGALDARQVMDVLSQPLSGMIEGFTDRDIRQGLRAHTYPNGRLMRNAKALGKTARPTIREMRRGITDLVSVLDHDKSYEDVVANVHLYGELHAELESRMKVGVMRPSAIKNLCDEHGLNIDEVMLWRLKGKRPNSLPVDISRAGVDPAQLAQIVVDSSFSRKRLVGTGETALIPLHELSNEKWAARTPYVERLKRLTNVEPLLLNKKQIEAYKAHDSSIVDDVAERWKVLFRRHGTPRHLALPIIQWRADTRQQDRELIYNGNTTYYDSMHHRVLHVSPVLGAVMLASNLPQSALESPLAGLAFGDRQPPLAGNELPRKAVGYLAGVLADNHVALKLIHSDAFKSLEQRIAVK